MTPLTILSSALALSIVACVLAFRRNGKLARKVKEQDRTIDRYIRADNDTAPMYTVETVTDGRIWVCRNSMVDNHLHKTGIKLFTDPDEDFNRREAAELMEKLNEK